MVTTQAREDSRCDQCVSNGSNDLQHSLKIMSTRICKALEVRYEENR